ncbi:hypothetical protein BGX27_008374 [Mortierella sp. AM989]|nr:hypothetical protein BGX27_008374 [Mortierella sp. AM989]
MARMYIISPRTSPTRQSAAGPSNEEYPRKSGIRSRSRSFSTSTNGDIIKNSLSPSPSAMDVNASENPDGPLKFVCKNCEMIFSTQQDLQRHSRDHPSSEIAEQNKCMLPGCSNTFRSKKSLTAHMRSCKQKVAKPRHQLKYGHGLVAKQRGSVGAKHPCNWDGCNKILATPKSLKDHMQIHAEREAGIELPCPVDGCGKMFGTHRCLRAHELRCKQVKSGQRLPCPYPDCNATFGSTDYVRRHELDHEKGLIGVQFSCDFPNCVSVLANPLTLQRHKQLHDEQSLGFRWLCLVEGCGKPYSGSKQLADHQTRIHKGTYRFKCPYNECKKLFECQRTAYTHECLNKKSKCPYEDCSCFIPNEEALERHKWMHETITARPPFPCFEDGCNKVFDSKNGILAHLLTHDITNSLKQQ